MPMIEDRKEKMFDNDRIDKRKRTENGPLYDISQMSTVSNMAKQ